MISTDTVSESTPAPRRHRPPKSCAQEPDPLPDELIPLDTEPDPPVPLNADPDPALPLDTEPDPAVPLDGDPEPALPLEEPDDPPPSGPFAMRAPPEHPASAASERTSIKGKFRMASILLSASAKSAL